MTPLQSEFVPRATAVELCAHLRSAGGPTLLLDGAGKFDRAWSPGPLLAIRPRVLLEWRPGTEHDLTAALACLETWIQKRRESGGTGDTGLAVLLAYDLFAPRRVGSTSDLPDLVVLAVDRSVRFLPGGSARLTTIGHDDPGAILERILSVGDGTDPTRSWEDSAARIDGVPATSLPREDYLAALGRLQEHIRLGDVYQANLCQRFEAGYRGDTFSWYRKLREVTPAPLSAYLEAGTLAVASASPETFVKVTPDGEATTWPIKGTRPRGDTATGDLAAAKELTESIKDRAELVMIVDLERNDLSRICMPGTVVVPELATLTSYATVHHLVARVEGRLRTGIVSTDLLQAMFPGGSITGAPKVRAMEILMDLEPVSRNFFTGSLCWFGDDGSLDSSILIRTMVFDRTKAYLGAGGGIVADSVPEQEWLESNHKARPLTQVLGFDPLEAG